MKEKKNSDTRARRDTIENKVRVKPKRVKRNAKVRRERKRTRGENQVEGRKRRTRCMSCARSKGMKGKARETRTSRCY